MRHAAATWAALACLAAFGPAAAQDLRKCVGADGAVTYTNQGCPAASKTDKPVRITDSTMDMSQDMLAAERIRREQAAEAARLRSQVAVGMQHGKAGTKSARVDDAAGAGQSDKECAAAAPRGLSPGEKAEFLAACMSGQPMAQRPARSYGPAPQPSQAPRTMFCSGPSGNLFCF